MLDIITGESSKGYFKKSDTEQSKTMDKCVSHSEQWNVYILV